MNVGVAARPMAGRTPYEEHRDYVLAVLSRRCRWLDPSDREALFHDAYAVLLEKQRDGKLDVDQMGGQQIRAYLTQTALNKAMDEGKRAGRRRSVSLDDDDLGIDPIDPGRAIDEQLTSRFDDARVREIVAQLPERQQVVIKLRFFFNRSPQEIQRYMGITERVYRRELERASRQLAERFELLRDGTFCESRRSLMLAYVTGVAGPSRRVEARRHLDTCPACASWVLEMRAATRRSAAFVPAPLLTLPLHRWGLGRLVSTAHGTRHRITELVAHARARGAQALVRADPSRLPGLTGIRPGTAAAIITGCLATGTSATYCVVHGLPSPLRSLVASAKPEHRRHHARRGLKPASTTTLPVTVTPSTPAPDTLAPEPTPTPVLATVPSHAKPVAAGRNGTPSRHRAHAGARAVTAKSMTASAHANAARIEKTTSPEFGVGGGTPAPSSATAAATTPSQPVASAAASSSPPSSSTASASSPPSSPTASGSSPPSTSPPAKSTKPSSEFDP